MSDFISSLVPTKKNAWFLLIAIVFAVVISFLNVALPWFLFLGILIFGVITFFVFKSPAIGIILIAFFLPFERIGTYEFETMTIRISQILFIVVIAVWLGRLIAKGKYSFVRNPLMIPLVIFLLISFFSLPNSLNIERSVLVFIFILFTSFLSFVIPNLIKNKDSLNKIIIALFISFILVSAFGIFQFLGDMSGFSIELTGLRDLYTKDVLGFTRIQSTAYEPLYFANYLLIPLGLIYALFLAGKGRISSSWLIVLLALGAVNLILTVSRGGYLALAFTVLAISLFYLRKVFTLKNMLILVVAGLIVFWVVTQTIGFGGEALNWEKFTEHIGNAFYGASYDERVDTFENAISAWRGHPFIGVGVGGFGPYMAPHPYYMPKDGWRIVNNEFIEILAENGILGLFAFSLFLLILIIRSIKAIIKTSDSYLRAIMVALLGTLVGIIVQYQTFSTLYIMHVWFLIGLMIACQNIIFSSYARQNTPVDKES